MGHSLKELRHFIVAAADGDIGEVKDVYFDDEHWAIRYMVVETGRWLNGRKVLVSPNSVRDVVWDDRIVNVELSRQQVRDSPSIDTDKPVSRQHEVEYYNYYGYPNYWEGSNPRGLGFYPVPWVGASADSVLSAQRMDQARMREPHPRVGGRPVDSHLRSTREVIGYEIMATDGTIGRVEDFLFDAARWVVRYVVVDTRKWLRGKHVLLPPQYVASISWPEHEVYLTVAQDVVETSPDHEPSDPLQLEPETRVEDDNPR